MHAHVFPIAGVGGYGVCSVRTKDMELLSLSVLYIQGSDAGQK